MATDPYKNKWLTHGSEGATSWTEYTPYPYSVLADIKSGQRKHQRACQYLAKNLPTICVNANITDDGVECLWPKNQQDDASAQSASEDANKGKPKPNGYSGGSCDNLGRNTACNKYEARQALDESGQRTGEPENDDDQWVCIAPDPYRSGLTITASNSDTTFVNQPIPKSQIKGYNESTGDAGKHGQCDGEGLGTGSVDGSFKEKDKKPVVCNYYRPWSMGFGARVPHPGSTEIIGGAAPTGIKASRQTYKAALVTAKTPMDYQLPYSFDVWNFRSKYQKCQHWSDRVASQFYLREIEVADWEGGTVYTVSTVIALEGARYVCSVEHTSSDVNKPGVETNSWKDFWTSGRTFYEIILVDADLNEVTSSDKCQSPFPETAEPYYKIETSQDVQPIIDSIWAKGDTIVCNGAHPDCPCYTGNWQYCVTENMKDGMRITANQVFELRFWMSNWQSQAEYDKFFIQRPGTNPRDPTTADLYTFEKWKQQTGLNDPSASSSVMKGSKLHMCMPAPLFNREFDPDDYITTTSTNYPLVNTKPGTAAPNQPTFPTLIRKLVAPDKLRELDVYYPYISDTEEFDQLPCAISASTGYTKRSNSVEGDSISVVGYVEGDGTVIYVINSSGVTIPTIVRTNDNARGLSDDERTETFSALKTLIDKLRYEASDYMTKTVATSTGYFITEPITLKHNKTNNLIVLALYSDNTWEWKQRTVKSEWCGGIIKQKSFRYVNANDNYLPEIFLPAAKAECELIPLGGSKVVGLMSVASYVSPSLLGDIFNYNYCKKLITKKVKLTTWTQIGITSRLLVSVDDINLNYLLSWSVVSATMTALDTDCGTAESVLKQVEVIDKLAIAPNMCIIEPLDGKPRRFVKSACTLTLTYQYEMLSNKGGSKEDFSNSQHIEVSEEIIFPVVEGAGSEFNRFTPGSAQVVGGALNSDGEVVDAAEGSYVVSPIMTTTLGIMAYFEDSDGRLISAFATKLLVVVPRVTCRSVEIYYSYTVPAGIFQLTPTGSCTSIGPSIPVGMTSHSERPPCGTHECLVSSRCLGPEWYPFRTCSESNFYNVIIAGAYCTNPYPGPGEQTGFSLSDRLRSDYRMCLPPQYKAWTKDSGNSLRACGCNWNWYYSVAPHHSHQAHRFSGYANVVTSVNEAHYRANDWKLPPFGNFGRDMVERFISQDSLEHWTTGLSTKKEWMPIMMDNSMFFMTFNAFDEESFTNAPDCFSFVSQMNFLHNDDISEQMVMEDSALKRYRFDEIFGLDSTSKCTYPRPIRTVNDKINAVDYYFFKDEEHTWAWREAWKDIDRDVEVVVVPPEEQAGRLYFASIEKPDYVYDSFKNEHRYICDEDKYFLKYTPPELNDEGVFVKYPSISLRAINEPEAQFERYFEVIYDAYNSSKIEWKDEGNGEVSGSGGTTASANIYETTNTSKPIGNNGWNHDDDILFSSDALNTIEKATAAGRIIRISFDIYAVPSETFRCYNRGLIINITRESLNYLPVKEIDVASGDAIKEPEPTNPGDVVSIYEPSEDGLTASPVFTIPLTSDVGGGEQLPVCVTNVEIKGKWGKTFNSEGVVTTSCKPGIIIKAVDVDAVETNLVVQGEDLTQPKIPGDELTTLRDYTIIAKLPTTPTNMLTKRATTLKISFSVEAGHMVHIGEIKLKKSEYVGKTEVIEVWERKYNASKYFDPYPDSTINLDGPAQALNYRPNENSGVYFIAHSNHYPGTFRAMNKMRSTVAEKWYKQFTRVPATDQAGNPATIVNLQDVEEEAQRELYKTVYNMEDFGDVLTYTGYVPESISDFLTSNGIMTNALKPGTVFTSNKPAWDDGAGNATLQIAGMYTRYDYWAPQGHTWEWGDEAVYTKCGIIGPYEYVYGARFLHLDSGTSAVALHPMTALSKGNFDYINRVIRNIETQGQ